jgi:hypothetical protein
MLLSLNTNWWEDWELYHKVTFDGINRKIIINDGISILNVKEDIYSSWKEWLSLRDNSKFLPAFRTIGGDQTSTGIFAGDIYFLINNWQIIVNQNVEFVGAIYQDDNLSPFIIGPGGGVRSTVSNLVQSVQPNVIVDSIPEISEINNKIAAMLLQLESVKTSVDTLPTAQTIKNSVWNASISDHTTSGTFGHFMQKKLITVAKFLGLK